MGAIQTGFANAFRDFTTEGVPASGAHQPAKGDIRNLGPLIEADLSRRPLVAATQAALVLLDPTALGLTSGSYAVTLGATAAGDTRPTHWRWDAASTTTPSATVLRPSSGPSATGAGRWVREAASNTWVDVQIFGAQNNVFCQDFSTFRIRNINDANPTEFFFDNAAGTARWGMGRSAANTLYFNRYNASGGYVSTPFSINDSGDVIVGGMTSLAAGGFTVSGAEVIAAGGYIRGRTNTVGGLPAAGTAGRIASVSDRGGALFADDGSAWRQVADVRDVFARPMHHGAAGNGTTDDRAALLAAANASAFVFIRQPHRIASNVTLPAGRTYFFDANGSINPDAGVTVTMDGEVIAPNRQIFGGAGNVVGLTLSKPVWHGAPINNTGNAQPGWQKALACVAADTGAASEFVGPRTIVSHGTSRLSAPIDVNPFMARARHLQLIGAGGLPGGSRLVAASDFAGGDTMMIVDGQSPTNVAQVLIKGLGFIGTVGSAAMRALRVRRFQSGYEPSKLDGVLIDGLRFGVELQDLRNLTIEHSAIWAERIASAECLRFLDSAAAFVGDVLIDDVQTVVSTGFNAWNCTMRATNVFAPATPGPGEIKGINFRKYVMYRGRGLLMQPNRGHVGDIAGDQLIYDGFGEMGVFGQAIDGGLLEDIRLPRMYIRGILPGAGNRAIQFTEEGAGGKVRDVDIDGSWIANVQSDISVNVFGCEGIRANHLAFNSIGGMRTGVAFSGNTTAGDPVITGVTNVASLAVNDAVLGGPFNVPITITARNVGAQTITVSAAPQATLTGVGMFAFATGAAAVGTASLITFNGTARAQSIGCGLVRPPLGEAGLIWTPARGYRIEPGCHVMTVAMTQMQGNVATIVDDGSPSTVAFTGTLTNGQTTVTGVTNIAALRVGMPVSGTGVPAGAIIWSLDAGASSIVLSAAATAGGAQSLTATVVKSFNVSIQ